MRLMIELPDMKTANSLVRAIIKGGGIEHPEHPGLFSVAVRTVDCFVEVIYPDPKPTIPELIAGWHSYPSPENRKALRAALAEHGTAFIRWGTAYRAILRNGVEIIEVY